MVDGDMLISENIPSRYSLSTIHYPLSTIHYPPSTIHYPLSTIHYPPLTNPLMKLKGKFIETAIRVLIAALTAALTAVTTTSCMGYGPVNL